MPSLRPFQEVWALALLLAFDHAQSKQINSFAGPFIAYGYRADHCPSEIVSFSLRVTHFNPQRPYDPQFLSGELTFQEDYGDYYMTSFTLDKRSNNQWKDNFFILKFPNVGCSVMRNQIPDLFRIFAKHSGRGGLAREFRFAPFDGKNATE
ncbi:uncharacterized protein LOC117643017 [Thrips palmi]|uniref:Uncharacterized protein LOC117643017 n=1 Tax=Thrips palmi TaxID=161013 RepID=A0A6P8ZKR2_THRPL|nr:uncharacterized protein LOC117643017 [Thrips palmi]